MLVTEGFHVPCFSANTPIRLGDGTARAIEEIRVGDVVAAFDEHDAGGRGALRPAAAERVLRGFWQLRG